MCFTNVLQIWQQFNGWFWLTTKKIVKNYCKKQIKFAFALAFLYFCSKYF